MEAYYGETVKAIGGPVEESHENPDFGSKGDGDDAGSTDSDDEDDDDGDNGTHQHDGSTFGEAVTVGSPALYTLREPVKVAGYLNTS